METFDENLVCSNLIFKTLLAKFAQKFKISFIPMIIEIRICKSFKKPRSHGFELLVVAGIAVLQSN